MEKLYHWIREGDNNYDPDWKTSIFIGLVILLILYLLYLLIANQPPTEI